MSNSKTIDGVSLAVLSDAFDELPDWNTPAATQLRALLDADKVNNREMGLMQFVEAHPVAPAVERQESVVFPRDLTDEMAEAIALTANCCGGIADDVWEGLVQCVEKPKHPDINVCGSWPVQSEPRPRISDLQSTIAQLEDKLNKAIDLDFQRRETIDQLQARVQELESGRGEPVAWQYRVSAGPATGWSLWHDGKGDEFRNSYQVENRPLFTAPSASVAVVPSTGQFCEAFVSSGYVDESQAEDLAGIATRACLDATAALNGVKS